MPSPPRLHVVALAHLDTQWRWTVRDTVRDHLPATVAANEALFARHPRYVLSFEGAHRYRLLAEHHPALFARVRERVREGRWAPAGAAVEAFDTLLPSPESIVRQIALGRRWFRDQLGADSRDLFLPDCFGFPATLPTLAVHAGVVGFSTQKLRRGELMRSAYGIPFAYGRWRGPDGSELLAALDPGEYSGRIDGDLSRDPAWLARFAELDRQGVPRRLLFYVGTGDRGGAVPEPTVAHLERALDERASIEVLHGSSESIFVATSDAERARLPAYEGELLLRLHGTGCYSAKAILKRWNRRCESLALAAESAAALERSLSPTPPPARTRIEGAWWRFLAHQMHDDLTGTSIPAAYRFTLDALGLAANELAESLLDSISSVAGTLARSGDGAPFVLFTPLGASRKELVEVELDEPLTGPLEAIDADGSRLPCQIVERGTRRIALLPVSFEGVEARVVRIVPGSSEPAATATLEVAADRLENDRYVAKFDRHGRLAALSDKRLGRELLAGPVELELLPNRSRKYPAWEIQWRDLSAEPVDRVDRLVARTVDERGPLRAALSFEHRARGCVARSTWSLAAGGDALTLELVLDWRGRGRLLELRFPFAAANDEAFYDTGLGAIARPTSSEALFEVPAQGWAALEDASGDFGGAVLTDVPRGWNQPDRSTLRTTLIHAPFPGNKFRHQATQDFGRHRWRFALLGMDGGAVSRGELGLAADRFRQPPLAFRVASGGESGATRRAALLSIENPLRLQALLPARKANELELRLSNPAARSEPVRVSPGPGTEIVAETDGLGEAIADAGDPLRPLAPSGLRTLALRISSREPATPPGQAWRAIPLRRTLRGFGAQGQAARDGGFDGHGNRFPLELVPPRLADAPVPFDLSHLGREPDTAPADGSELELGPDVVELWLLCASVEGEAIVDSVGRAGARVPDWRAPLLVESSWSAPFGLGRIRGGSFRRCAVVWSAGHLHDRRGDDRPVERASLFALRLAIGPGSRLRLPREPKLRVVAASAALRPARLVSEAFAWPEP